MNSGEWSPNLFARVDIQKYRSGAALLENFFIDYRGGASTRPGTRYILQAYKSATPVRLIPFQASFSIGYALEFGDHYIRFFYQGAPVLEAAQTISGATQANPCVLTITAHNLNPGDWIYISGVGGMTQLNGNFYSVLATTTNTVTLGDLNGNNINSAAYTAYTTGGSAQRVYTLASPYAAADVGLLKYSQATNEMVICHPSYPPYLLTLISATSWTLSQITIGTTSLPPTSLVVTSTLSTGTVNYAYVVTGVDSNGQESMASTIGALASKADIRSVAGTNTISWTASATAVSYNVYEASVSYAGVVPSGINYGFIGNTTNTTFIDSNIGQDFSVSPPIAQNPFAGGGVASVAVTLSGSGYSAVPAVSFSGGSPTTPAVATASLGSVTTPTIGSSGGSAYKVNDTVTFFGNVTVKVTAVSGNSISAWTVLNQGSVTSGSVPTGATGQIATSGSGHGVTAIISWGVLSVTVDSSGSGYTSTPNVVFSSGAATATATLSANYAINPQVPSFFQQRLILASTLNAPQTFWMSQPGVYFNFNTTNPVEPDNAITETIVDGTLQTIQSIGSATSGMLIFTDRATWLVNGGSSGSAVSPSAIVANKQSSIGASAVPPIVANYDILFVQAKGSAVRDLANVFTGSDISITASHLFYGYNITSWAWAEQPFYVVWAVRNDGVMLTLTFLKEQEFIGWSHQITQGLFQSVCAVTETTSDAGTVDAVYTVVQRTVNGNTVQYIERVADRVFPNGLSSAWCVDAGIQFSGSATLTFQGAQHLAGLTVTGLATDDQGNVTIITPFAMPTSGQFTLPAPPSPATGYVMVTVGLGFTCKLQTLAIDTGQAPIQGKLKKIPEVDVRVKDTLGLTIGSDFAHQVPMKDLVLGNVSSQLTGQSNQIITGLTSGDARTILDNTYTVPGQYCIGQYNPYPATVLGVFPTLVMGDVD
jgi:hypothetical protein